MGWLQADPQTPDESRLPVSQQQLDRLSISHREYEVLELIAAGHTSQQIADRLFISLNTVKKHSSNQFSKLDVKRRTQVVQKAKELEIIE